MERHVRILYLAIALNLALSVLAVALLYKDPTPLEAVIRMLNPEPAPCFVEESEIRRQCNEGA